MPESAPQEHRFKTLFTWGGLLVAVLGLLLVWIGYHFLGIAVVAAGVIFWLVVKRRARQAAESPPV